MSGENRRRRHRSLLARDGECCNYCGAPGELTIDHRFPKSLGGVDALWNLQLLCRPCNEIKGASGAGRETVLRLRGAQASRGSSVEERGIPNPCVAGSTPALGTVGYALIAAGVAA